MDDCGIRNHETIGSHFALKLGFTPRVVTSKFSNKYYSIPYVVLLETVICILTLLKRLRVYEYVLNFENCSQANLICNHVSAKRYLCWKYPDYHAKLSPASRTTLRHQGGPMSSTEVIELLSAGYIKRDYVWSYMLWN
jgi:hypothetical protein